MATIGSVSLTIELGGGNTSEVTVEYPIRFSSLDVLGNLEYRERVRLRGADSFPNGGDDELTTLQNVRVRPNGQATLNRRIVRQVANSTLNEDSPFQDDEIYARVNLRDVDGLFQPVRRDSNEVSGSF
ncbi:MAG: hypothetical protein ACRDRY_19925 [Pseudonocardiaceae bacterium]